MNRLALLIACLAAAASSAGLAANRAAPEDPAFCKSMCASEQNACRAEARLPSQDERLAQNDMLDRNPFARTAQGAVARPELRALDAAGDQNRKNGRLGSCDATYQRCTRSCAAPAPARVPTPAPANPLSPRPIP